jgi:hypothetical protein
MLIATRILKFGGSERAMDIPIRIFAPQEGPESGWFCRYEIAWPHGLTAKKAWGFDAVQAVYLTLQAIGADIYFSEYHKSGRLMLDRPARGTASPFRRMHGTFSWETTQSSTAERVVQARGCGCGCTGTTRWRRKSARSLVM